LIQRSFDCARVNELVNHPTIRPYIGGDGKTALDLTGAVMDLQNFFLCGPNGGFLVIWSAPQTYEIHTFILPEGRGREAYQLARAGRDFMVEQGATHLWTRVHPDARNVRRFTLSAGFKPAGEHTIDLGFGPVTYDLFDWRA
jgi:hypothetical protein